METQKWPKAADSPLLSLELIQPPHSFENFEKKINDFK